MRTAQQGLASALASFGGDHPTVRCMATLRLRLQADVVTSGTRTRGATRTAVDPNTWKLSGTVVVLVLIAPTDRPRLTLSAGGNVDLADVQAALGGAAITVRPLNFITSNPCHGRPRSFAEWGGGGAEGEGEDGGGSFCQMRHGHTSRGQYIALCHEHKLLAAELRRRHIIITVYSLVEKPYILLYSYILPFGSGLGPRVG